MLKEKEVFLVENRNFTKENQNLKIEVNKLKSIIDKFTLSSNKLQMILENQKVVYNKVGPGIAPKKNKIFEKYICKFFTR